MAKKKSTTNSTPTTTPTTTTNSYRPKPSTSKVNKSDVTTEKPKTEPKEKEKLTSIKTSNPSNNQRRKGSLANILNDETTPKRRTSSRLNRNPTILISTSDEDDDDNQTSSLIKSSDEQPIFIKSDDHDHDQPTFQTVTPEFISRAEVKKEEGNVHFRLAKYTDAIKSYSEAIDLNGDNPAYLSNRAAASMALGDYQSALHDMEIVNSSKFIQLGIQPSIKNKIRLIRCLLPLGKFYLARQNLNEILNQFPDSFEIKKQELRLNSLEFHLNSLQTHRRDQQWSTLLTGLSVFEKELDCGTLNFKDWLIWKVEALCGLKQWEDANDLCLKLVRSFPSDPEVLYNRAKVMYSLGNLSATVLHCQEAMKFDPDFSSARNLLRQAKNIESLKESGNASFKASDYQTALKKYSEARTLDPNNQAIVVTLDSNRAQALLKSGKNQDAIDICTQILKINSKHFKALRTRGRAHKNLSDLPPALLDFQDALPLAPSSAEESEIFKDIKATKILISRGQFVDHYKVLGVARNATAEEIKKAFHKKSLIHHPDKGGNQEKFKEVNEAYRVLQDPQSRRKFDISGPGHPGGSYNMGQERNNPFAYDTSPTTSFAWEHIFKSDGRKEPPLHRHPPAYHSHAFHPSTSYSSSAPKFNGF